MWNLEILKDAGKSQETPQLPQSWAQDKEEGRKETPQKPKRSRSGSGEEDVSGWQQPSIFPRLVTWSNQDKMAGPVMSGASAEWRGRRLDRSVGRSACSPRSSTNFQPSQEETRRQQDSGGYDRCKRVTSCRLRSLYNFGCFTVKPSRFWPPCVWSLLLLVLRSTRRPRSATSASAAPLVPGTMRNTQHKRRASKKKKKVSTRFYFYQEVRF